MSSLISLQIKGLRSYHPDPEDPSTQTITFDGPVTLISGENGTGKTTIIESLKYATVGVCSKEIVADPHLWNQDRINGEVSLEFESPTGKTVKVQRGASLVKTALKKTGATFGNQACHITIDNHDGTTPIKKTANSTESNIEIPQLLGVSPAILENVIFCDQQNSCWPLEDSAKRLKERFDEIFGAEKYEKAKKALKEVEKQLKEEKNTYEKESSIQTKNQESYLRIQSKIENNRKRIIKLDEEQSDLQVRHDDYQDKINEYDQHSETINNLKGKINANEEKSKIYLKKMNEEKSQIIGDLHTTDECYVLKEELETKQKELKRKLETIKYTNVEQNRKLEKLMKESENLRNELDIKKNLMGGAQAQHDFYMKTLAEFEKEYQSKDYEEVLLKKREEYQMKKKEFDSFEDKTKKSAKKLSKEIQRIDGKYFEVSSKIKSYEQQINDKLKDLNQQKYDENEINEIQNKINIEEEDYKTFISNTKSEEQIQNEIKQNEEQQQQIKVETNKYIELQKKCTLQSTIQQKYSLLQSTIYTLKEKIETQLENIKKVLGNVTVDNIEETFNKVYNGTKTEYENLKLESDKISNEIMQNKIQLENYQNKLIKGDKQIKETESKLQLFIQDDQFEDVYKQKKQELTEAQNKLTRFQNSEEIYKNFEKEANELHWCPLCERKFNDENSLIEFIKNKISLHIQNLPTKLEKCEKKIKRTEKELKTLELLKPEYEQYKKNIEQRESLQQHINELKLSLENLEDKKQKILEKLNIVNDSFELLRTLNPEIKSYLNNNNELNNNLIEESNLSSQFDSSLPSYLEITDKVNEMESIKSDLYMKHKQLTDEYTLYVQRTSKNKSEIQNLKHMLQKNLDKQKNYNEINEKINYIKNEKEKLEKEFEQIQTERESIHLSHSQLEEENSQKIEAESNILRSYELILNECENQCNILRKSQEELSTINSGELPQQINELQIQIDQNKTEIQTLQNNININNQEEHEINNEIFGNINTQLTSIIHQINYLNEKKEFDIIQNEIQVYNNELNQILRGNSFNDITKIKEEYKVMHDKLIEIQTSLRNEKSELKKNQEELKLFNDANEKLTAANIKLQATIMSISDVTKYSKVLDETLLEFHSQKMDEINETIQSLWDHIYFGKDIDGIEIKAEPAATGRASYNYRVVMHKDGITLDMCNRCSAGQKVLASIIVRLALAETFSINCGVIALDEPTTNLDQPNMQNLALELIKLVESRQKNAGKPFQIIIITHCNQFVEQLMQSGFFNHFYQITRRSDGEHTYSQISRVNDNVLK
ncbi:DNA repair protein rad50 [Histomonas meleagridis]|uniref:DNA repair protein rad50 n=1 Tax=Histomonas meleagridis TaxID=135588 RepID=UPI00355A226C|nr:DNA repair protein rad50 [Histomonas meleagridis]KAH0800137.1 DNA repair protein rad50 [Histomonas meleagridis]